MIGTTDLATHRNTIKCNNDCFIKNLPFLKYVGNQLVHSGTSLQAFLVFLVFLVGQGFPVTECQIFDSRGTRKAYIVESVESLFDL